MGLFAALAAAMAMAAQAAPPPVYAEGQVWEYRTRPGDEGSRLKIQKIESVPALEARGPVYHISVIDVHLGDQIVATGLQHAPVSRQTLDASVTRLSDAPAVFPSVEQGLAQWREAEGGVFTITVAQIVEALDQAMREAMPPGE